MIIDKSQGQSVKHVEIFISQSIFSHDQLYIIISRVTFRKRLEILITEDEDNAYKKYLLWFTNKFLEMSNTKCGLWYFYLFKFRLNETKLSLIFLYHFHGFQGVPWKFILLF